MYEEAGCFDLKTKPETAVDGGCSQLPPQLVMAGSTTNSFNELAAYNQNETSPYAETSAVEMHIQNQLAMNMNMDTSNQIQSGQYSQADWEDALHNIGLENAGYNSMTVSRPESHNPPTPDLLSLLHLPRSCSTATTLLPNPSISFSNPNITDIMAASSVMYDPLFHLNLPPQPPLFRELYQSPPDGYATNLTGSRSGCLLGADDQTGPGFIYPDANTGQFDNGLLEFTRDIGACSGKGRGSGKMKRFTTERERRTHLNDRFDGLKALIPAPSKGDRASVVLDAINYIKELLRTVADLKLLVERKRCGRKRSKVAKTDEDSENKLQSEIDQSFSNNSLRSSWLQRKSKVTEVDVRIVDDEVTIKLIQKKKINCLLFVSKVLDQLQLDLHHVAGGQIGEHYSFLFNTKIHEGSSVYASAIANKIIEVVEEQYMAASPTSSYYFQKELELGR